MSGEYHHSGGTDRPDLPPLYIDAGSGEGAPPGADEPDRPVAWKRLALTAIIVVSAIVATAIVADTRHEAEMQAAAASEVSLVVGGLRSDYQRIIAEDGSVRINVDIFNSGGRDVKITSLGFRGWEHVPLEGDEDFLVPAGKWAPVPLRTRADCDTVPAVLEAEVWTDAGERSVLLDLPVDAFTMDVLEFPCRSHNDDLWYESFDAEVLQRTDDGLIVRYLVNVMGNGSGLTGEALGVSVVGVSADIPGFSAELVEPVDLHRGENRVDIAWRIAGCADATTFTNGTVELETDDGDRRIFGPGQVPMALSVELARFAADVCNGDAG